MVARYRRSSNGTAADKASAGLRMCGMGEGYGCVLHDINARHPCERVAATVTADTGTA